ncbi:hypothetical protein [Photorhabdus bodei]|uniref:Uncharacterized protein n=1 Tax=Photorhabdus bodei TaxID=2029681 RepID=A0AAW6BL99_9GAMM|nr:hypothetical protein [Photorhabdus bodei]MDB6369225.1 hypothetical protein [Photorhabdus bodei]MDB6374323.1 hypothetical protein [Photorhabdus bodei]
MQRDRIVFFIPQPGIKPGDRKVEGITELLNIDTIFDENYIDTYAVLGEQLS